MTQNIILIHNILFYHEIPPQPIQQKIILNTSFKYLAKGMRHDIKLLPIMEKSPIKTSIVSSIISKNIKIMHLRKLVGAYPLWSFSLMISLSIQEVGMSTNIIWGLGSIFWDIIGFFFQILKDWVLDRVDGFPSTHSDKNNIMVIQ